MDLCGKRGEFCEREVKVLTLAVFSVLITELWVLTLSPVSRILTAFVLACFGVLDPWCALNFEIFDGCFLS